MKTSERIVNALMRFIFRLMYRMDLSEFDKVPKEGPFIIIANHTSTLDGPLMYVFMRPRNMIAMAKKELWNNPFTRFLMNLWRIIPVDRGNMGRETMERCFTVLQRGEILAIAPEGTRNNSGELQEGKAGVAFIAHRMKVPMVPIYTLGYHGVWENLKRFRRTKLTIKVGKPFAVAHTEGRLDAAHRQQLADEIMLRLAELMPESLWGVYRGRQLDFILTRTAEDLQIQ